LSKVKLDNLPVFSTKNQEKSTFKIPIIPIWPSNFYFSSKTSLYRLTQLFRIKKLKKKLWHFFYYCVEPLCPRRPPIALMPSSSALIQMSICTLQCLFSHSFTTYERLNRDCDVQIYIGITSR
jgi:hypothetical protein